MKMIYTEAMCRADALREEAAGDPDCSAGAAVAPLRAAAQVVALEPERPDGHGVNWLAGKRPKPGDLLYGGDAVARALAAKNEAETNALKAAQEADELRAKLSATLDALADEVETSNTLRLQVEALGAAVSTAFVPLRAHGVLDADDNLDCWDTPPFELARRHVEALNAKDPAAMWRVAQLYVLGPNPEFEINGHVVGSGDSLGQNNYFDKHYTWTGPEGVSKKGFSRWTDAALDCVQQNDLSLPAEDVQTLPLF